MTEHRELVELVESTIHCVVHGKYGTPPDTMAAAETIVCEMEELLNLEDLDTIGYAITEVDEALEHADDLLVKLSAANPGLRLDLKSVRYAIAAARHGVELADMALDDLASRDSQEQETAAETAEENDSWAKLCAERAEMHADGKLDPWDRITFCPELTVAELRQKAAEQHIHIRPKASRDEVARIYRQYGLAA